MFESLSERLQNIIQDTTRVKELTQDNMKEALREIRRALLEADVNLRVVKSFISNIKDTNFIGYSCKLCIYAKIFCS